MSEYKTFWIETRFNQICKQINTPIMMNTFTDFKIYGLPPWNIAQFGARCAPVKLNRNTAKKNHSLFYVSNTQLTLERLRFWSYIKVRNGPFRPVNILNAISQGKHSWNPDTIHISQVNFDNCLWIKIFQSEPFIEPNMSAIPSWCFIGKGW